MSIKLTLKTPAVDLTVEGTTQIEVFRKISQDAEVFLFEPCGACGCDLIKPRTRIVPDPKNPKKEYEYFELICTKCYARLSYGQHHNDSGTLFPKRKDKGGAALENRGWVRFNKNNGRPDPIAPVAKAKRGRKPKEETVTDPVDFEPPTDDQDIPF